MTQPFLRTFKLLALLLAASCLWLLAACSGVHSAVTLPPTATLTASPASINSGQSATLTWSTSNATSISIDQGVGANLAASGSATVSPTQTTTYTLTASNAGGSITATATVTVTAGTGPTVTITANPTTISAGASSVLTVVATNSTQVVISNNIDSTVYKLPGAGGTQSVSPRQTVTYTATATGNGQTVTATVVVTVNPASIQSIQHVIFLLQENRTFDSYFGMLNPYRKANNLATGDDGVEYDVDGIEDKLGSISNTNDEGTVFKLFHTTSSCLDDMTSAWLESYGDVARFNFKPNRVLPTAPMDGFVHVAEGFAKSCVASGTCSGTFTDLAGQRAMAYYQDTGANGPELNYYYYMASQFALADRWFSPFSSKSTPNRIATYSGGTTQGFVRDPFIDDRVQNPNIKALSAETIFQELDQAQVPWKIYYSETLDGCPADGTSCAHPGSKVPSTTFNAFGWSGKYLYNNPTHAPCTGTTVAGDAGNNFCIDPTRIAPITQYYTDVAANTLPSFGYIEAEYGISDEHPGSGQSVLTGQRVAAKLINALMTSPSWPSSAFFLAYDEAGGPYDHVPPVPGHSNDKTDPSVAALYPDIRSIAVNADSLKPCQPPADPTRPGLWTPTQGCDLKPDLAGNPPGVTEPGDSPLDDVSINGFAAQLGFRIPNMIISPYTRKHYVGHTPMDHTAILKFVETRFLPSGAGHLTPRVAAQPDLLDFFDFVNSPWLVPPANIPTPPPVGSTCHPSVMQ